MRFGRDVRPANVGVLVRLPILLTLAALATLALGGCTADELVSQPLSPFPQTFTPTRRVVCSDANPIQYAQTCGFYIGGHRSH
jgi:hypothetical protein